MSRRSIFCISPGRSGTAYLAGLLGSAAGVEAHHEAEPQMIGPYLRMIERAPYPASYAGRRFKAAAIAAGRAPVYADTSHMFVKTFHDVVVRECEGVEVVILRRPLARVLKSFVELSYLDRHRVSYDWMSSPNAATAAIRAIDADDRLDGVDRALAYLIDVEARAVRFRREHPTVPVHEFTLGEICEPAGVRRLFDALRLSPTRTTPERIGRLVNDKAAMKAEFACPISIEACERRIERHLARAAALGIEPPASLLR